MKNTDHALGPWHSKNALAWPPSLHRPPWSDRQLVFRISRLGGLIAFGQISALAARGDIDLFTEDITFSDRLALFGVGVGRPDSGSMLDIQNVQTEDLRTGAELLGVARVTVTFSDNEVDLMIASRDVLWPKSEINPKKGKRCRGVDAIVASLRFHSNLARWQSEHPAKVNEWLKRSGLEPFYREWKKVIEAGNDPSELHELVRSWKKTGLI